MPEETLVRYRNFQDQLLGILSGTGIVKTKSSTQAYPKTFLLFFLGLGLLSACNDVSNAPAPPPEPGALAIASSSPLPSGSIGIPYSTTLAASGGNPGYGWSLASGSPSLPAGLNLSPAGVISGRPTTIQTVSPKFRVVDSSTPAAQTVEKALSIAINAVPQPAISAPATLPNGIIGQTYPLTQLTASGGTPPYTGWTVTPALPSGLVFSTATGTISGTPSTTSNQSHTFTVTDSFSPTPQDGSRQYTLTVSPAPLPLTITTSSLPSGTQLQPYSATVIATGGTPSLTWSVASGLPPGLQLNQNTGSLTGTPTTFGTFTPTFRVQDAGAPQQSSQKQLTITINQPAPLSITTGTLGNGILSQPYDQTVQATGGSGSRIWSFQGGTIPNLSINSATGRITGNPTPTGNFTFTVQVTDALFTATKQFTIAVTPPPPPSITTPASLPIGTVNVGYPSTTLQATGGAPPLTFQPVGMPFGLSFDAASATIGGIPTSDGTANVTFTVHDSTIPSNQTGSKTYTIRVNSALTINTDDSASPLPVATTNQPYNATLVASGGTGPSTYTWSITSGGSTPAPGLSLSSSGAISGQPTTTGTFGRTYRVRDGNGVTATKILKLKVSTELTIESDDVGKPLTIGFETNLYSTTLSAAGGTPPYRWSVSPDLPKGLSLDTVAGAIAGIPEQGTAAVPPQKFLFTVRDSVNQSASKALTLTIISCRC